MTPYYLRIADALRVRIMTNELRKGDLLPSARVLAEQWGVATMTARNAVKVLEREGLVRGHQGKGVIVTFDPGAPEGPVAAWAAQEGLPAPGVTFGPPEGRHRREGTWICLYVPPSVDEVVARNIADDVFKTVWEMGWEELGVRFWTPGLETEVDGEGPEGQRDPAAPPAAPQ